MTPRYRTGYGKLDATPTEGPSINVRNESSDEQEADDRDGTDTKVSQPEQPCVSVIVGRVL